MKNEARLQLSEYSNKYKVSVSTLRRRIKAGEIQYDFEDGKYWLLDAPIEKYARNRNRPVSKPTPAPEPKAPEPVVAAFPVSNPDFSIAESYVTRDEVLEITNSMMSELKSAYVLVLQEKEASIMECKKEIADLKTLCHTLESENERLKAETHAPLSGWFLDDESEVEA